jgi:hypothetical protein
MENRNMQTESSDHLTGDVDAKPLSRKKHGKLWYVVIVTVVVAVVLAMFSVGSLMYALKHSKDMPSVYQGSVPFDQAQTIEEFQQKVEPSVPEMIGALQSVGFGEGMVVLHSGMEGCSEYPHDSQGRIDGFMIDDFTFRGELVDFDIAVKQLDTVLIPLGYDDKDQRTGESAKIMRWYDRTNGGHFLLERDQEEGYSELEYQTDCRPSNGSTTSYKDRVMPEWERGLSEVDYLKEDAETSESEEIQ